MRCFYPLRAAFVSCSLSSLLHPFNQSEHEYGPRHPSQALDVHGTILRRSRPTCDVYAFSQSCSICERPCISRGRLERDRSTRARIVRATCSRRNDPRIQFPSLSLPPWPSVPSLWARSSSIDPRGNRMDGWDNRSNRNPTRGTLPKGGAKTQGDVRIHGSSGRKDETMLLLVPSLSEDMGIDGITWMDAGSKIRRTGFWRRTGRVEVDDGRHPFELEGSHRTRSTDGSDRAAHGRIKETMKLAKVQHGRYLCCTFCRQVETSNLLNQSLMRGKDRQCVGRRKSSGMPKDNGTRFSARKPAKMQLTVMRS